MEIEIEKIIKNFSREEIQQYLQKNEEKKTRILINGCFDFMHAGHYNAIRQAKNIKQNVELVVGIHDDACILAAKGPTLMTYEERKEMIESCKWVHEVVKIEEYSYILPEFLDEHNCDYVAHGDDLPAVTKGGHMYQKAMDENRFLMFKRTEGVSTTKLIKKIMSISTGKEENKEAVYNFFPTSQRIAQFANKKREIEPQSVTYVAGTFDVFHNGHIRYLNKISNLGDFVITGVYSDSLSRQLDGELIMSCHERVLNLLACRYVDEVIIDAPLEVTKELITVMNIKSIVCTPEFYKNHKQSFLIAEELNLLKIVEDDSKFAFSTLVDRISQNLELFEKRNQKKAASDEAYESRQQFVPEK